MLARIFLFLAAAGLAMIASPMHPSYFGVSTHALNAVGAREIASLGANIVRTDVFAWDILEPRRGQYDFSSSDRAVAWARTHHVDLLGVLLYTPPWESGRSFAPQPNLQTDCGIESTTTSRMRVQPPRDPEDFAQFVYRTVKRYPEVHFWQIWNEPNNPVFWQPAPDAAAYGHLLAKAAAAVHRANPQAKVVLGGLSLVDLHYLTALYQQGAAESFDILAIHPYNPAQGPESYLRQEMERLRTVMATYGDASKPIWITELGWSTDTSSKGVSERTQAMYVNQLLSMSSSLKVQAIFWNTLEDCGSGYRSSEPEHNFGLFRKDHSPKPAADAYHDVVRSLRAW